MTGSHESAGSDAKRDVVGDFRRQPLAEKILAIGAAAFLIAFVIENQWKTLFQFGSEYYQPWMHTLAFVGSIAVLALVVTKLLGIRLVDPKLYNRLLVGSALLPAAGLLFDELREFWGFVMLASIVLMAYAGAKISTREQVLR